ncbi:uncharacterized protein [Centruroides vittatus]|uniref:uncharacterized protein n=1 Tax=Centruroides vittatus TaxID=120091 RepID=UPI00350FF04E
MSVSFIVLLLITGFLNVKGQRYDSCSELRSCEQKIDNLISSSSRLPSYQCRELVQNFNCMIKSIGCVREEDRQNYGSKIRRARDQHKTSCDGDEWTKKNNCFDGSEVRRCEDGFPRRAIIHNRDNCRQYDQYYECMRNAISRSCRGDDNEYILMYLLDMAHDLPWQCPQYSSSYQPVTSSPSWPSNGRGPYNNNTGIYNEICCMNERCSNDRLYQCRESLQKIINEKDAYPRTNNPQCRDNLNDFNCYFWQTYHCVTNRYEKNTQVLNDAKRVIESKCDANGDLQRSQCYTTLEIRDCDKYISDGRYGRGEIDCGKYKQFYDCVEQNLRRTNRNCNRNDELLFPLYLISRVNDKAWICSYDSHQTQYPYGTGSESSPYYPDDDSTCEAMVRQKFRHCENRVEEDEEAVRKITSSHERHTRSCCSALRYRECVREVVKKQCRRENSMVVDQLLGSSIRYRIQSCDDVSYSTCSGARTLSNIIFVAIALIFSRIYFQ